MDDETVYVSKEEHLISVDEGDGYEEGKSKGCTECGQRKRLDPDTDCIDTCAARSSSFADPHQR